MFLQVARRTDAMPFATADGLRASVNEMLDVGEGVTWQNESPPLGLSGCGPLLPRAAFRFVTRFAFIFAPLAAAARASPVPLPRRGGRAS